MSVKCQICDRARTRALQGMSDTACVRVYAHAKACVHAYTHTHTHNSEEGD